MLPTDLIGLVLTYLSPLSGYDFRFVSKQFYKARERAIRNETKLFFIITRNILMKQKYAELIKYKNLKYLSICLDSEAQFGLLYMLRYCVNQMKKLISLDIFGFENKELRQEIIGMFSGMTSLYIEGDVILDCSWLVKMNPNLEELNIGILNCLAFSRCRIPTLKSLNIKKFEVDIDYCHEISECIVEWKNLEILNLKASRYIFIKEILWILSNNNYSHLKEINLSSFMEDFTKSCIS